LLIGLLVAARFAHVDAGWGIVGMGLLLMAIGLWKLRRFLHDYPVLEAADGEE
jgi:hypothetical protein